MATLEVKFHDGSFEVTSQVLCCTSHDTWENRKAWFVILRSLRSPTTGKPFFSYQCLADAFATPRALIRKQYMSRFPWVSVPRMLPWLPVPLILFNFQSRLKSRLKSVAVVQTGALIVKSQVTQSPSVRYGIRAIILSTRHPYQHPRQALENKRRSASTAVATAERMVTGLPDAPSPALTAKTKTTASTSVL